MKTDKQLYAIFAAQPEWLFELTGLESPGACEMRAVALKALAQEADGIVVPRDPTRPLTVVEFQFQEDDAIYARTAIEMALVQQEQSMREVQGVIFFRYPSLDPKTEPWSRIIHAYALRDVLESLARRDPAHPLVAVFQPVLLSNEQTLAEHAREYYHQIKTSQLGDSVRQTLLDVFINWLEQRLKDKGKQEIENMLLGELPDLRETKSGQDLIRIGRDEGKLEGKIEGKLEGKLEGKREGKREGKLEGKREALLDLLEAKFGVVPQDLRSRIKRLDSLVTLKRLTRQVLTVKSLDQLQW